MDPRLSNAEILALTTLPKQELQLDIASLNHCAAQQSWDHSSGQLGAFVKDNLSRVVNLRTQDINTAVAQAEQLLDTQRKAGVTTISFWDSQYPKQLKEIQQFQDIPLLLHILGDDSLLHTQNRVAVVGSTHADKEGVENSYLLGLHASKTNMLISSLASGCDTRVHEGCIESGNLSIAISGCGLDTIFPKDSLSIRQRILDMGGAIVSCKAFGSGVNQEGAARLIAGLADKLIYVQGAGHRLTPPMMATIQALKYGREIQVCQYDHYEVFERRGNWKLISSGEAQPIDLSHFRN